MHLLSTPLLTLHLLLTPLIRAGGTYNANCVCYDSTKPNQPADGPATQSACDAIKHSDYWPGEFLECIATRDWGINDHCFDCLCKRTKGMYGQCYFEKPGGFKIKCGGGC